MAILNDIHITKHALERCRERLYPGINAAAIIDILKGKHASTYTQTHNNRDNRETFQYEYGGLRWVLVKNVNSGYTLITVYWKDEK